MEENNNESKKRNKRGKRMYDLVAHTIIFFFTLGLYIIFFVSTGSLATHSLYIYMSSFSMLLFVIYIYIIIIIFFILTQGIEKNKNRK